MMWQRIDAIAVLLALLLVLFFISPWVLAAIIVTVLAVVIWAVLSDRRLKQQRAEGSEWGRKQGREAAIEKSHAAPDWPSPAAERLAREKPPVWEFYLTEELLMSQLRPLRKEFDRLRTGAGTNSAVLLNESETLRLLQQLTERLKPYYFQLDAAFNRELIKAWGPSGVAGDAATIAAVVNDIICTCQGLLNWERELRTVVPPAEYVGIVRAMYGWGEHAFRVAEELTERLTNILAEPNPTGERTIALTVTPPPGTQTVEREMQQIVNRRQAQLRAQNDLVAASALLGLLGGFAAYHFLHGSSHAKPSMSNYSDG